MTKINNMSYCEQFTKSIFYVSIDGKELDLTKDKIQFKLYKNPYYKKYDNAKESNLSFFVNDKKVKNSSKIKVMYKCLTCGHTNTYSSVSRLLSKFNTKMLYCVHCQQLYDLEQRKRRSNAFKGKNTRIDRVYREEFKKEIEQKNYKIFDEMYEDFKKDYWSKNYKPEEWKQFVIDNNVVSVNGHSINDIEYIPYYFLSSCNRYFSAKIEYNGNVEGIKSVESKCVRCGKVFKFHWHKHEVAKHKTNGVCRDCVEDTIFCNGIWDIRTTTNCNGEEIKYQSLYELKFINFCNENNIHITNVEPIQYFWKNKIRNYYPDFKITELNWIIELKDMHKFQRNDIKSGKFYAKCSSAIHMVECGVYKRFLVLYQKQFNNEWKKSFLLYYLSETNKSNMKLICT